MKISEYKNNIRILTEHKLYLSALELIFQENIGLDSNRRKYEIVHNECKRRDIRIWENALEDSLIKLNIYDSERFGNSINNINRLEFMNDSEVKYNIKENSLLPESLGLRKEALMICDVSGDSMNDVNILDGDKLLVDKSANPQDGSIIIAKIEGKLYVKRLRLIEGNTWLYSENKNYLPICIDDTDFSIYGTVINKIT